MKKKILLMTLGICSIVMLTFTACVGPMIDKDESWRKRFNIDMPELGDELIPGSNVVNSEGWFATLRDDFNGDKLNNDNWSTLPHGKRGNAYWCPKMVSVDGGKVLISAEHKKNHNCTVCPIEGDFTSGIQSANTMDQAFGLYEARIKVPTDANVSSSFWLQSDSMVNKGNEGQDGMRVKVFDSEIMEMNSKTIGHSLSYDVNIYGSNRLNRISSIDTDIYDGFHIYSLLWTPTHYVFYVDGVATWASDFGGVSRVESYMLLGNEINKLKESIGKESANIKSKTMEIDYVKVYQNQNYLSHIKDASAF